MTVLSIAIKDLKIFLKNQGALLYLVLLPVLFIMLFAGLGGGSADGEELIPLPFVNLDKNGVKAQAYVDALKKSKGVAVTEYEFDELKEKMSKAKIFYAIVVPENFSADIDADLEVSVSLILHPNHDPMTADTVERVAEGAVRDVLMLGYLDESLDQLRDMQAANPLMADYFQQQEDAILAQAETQEAQAEERPLVVVRESTPASATEIEAAQIPDFGQIIAAGFAVLFVFLAAQTTAESIFNEKKQGSFRRLLAAPMSKGVLLAGKVLPNLILALFQIMIILLTATFLIPLLGVSPLDLSSDPLALSLASIVVALCSTSLGVLIAAVARTESQLGGVSNGILWVAGLIGGSIVPSFMMPDWLNRFARFIPHYWANQAFFGLFFRQEGLGDIYTYLLILLVFSAAFFLFGIWRFKFE